MKAPDEPGKAAVSAASAMQGLTFVATSPCRLADTRAGSGQTGAFGPPSLAAMAPRKMVVPLSKCGLPVAAAYSLNIVSVTPPGMPVGWLAAWSGDIANWPGTVVLNAVQGGVVNSPAVVAAGADGSIQTLASDATDLVIDINGYWVQQSRLNFRGEWSMSTAYLAGDVVTERDGGWSYGPTSTYIAVAPSTGVDPQSDSRDRRTAWNVLASAGAMGDTGATGPQGPAGATGATGPAGSSTGFLLTANINISNTTAGIWAPLSGSSDPTIGVDSFAGRATVMPVSCTIQKLYVFTSAISGGSAGVRVYRSAAGTGTPTDLGLFIASFVGQAASTSQTATVQAGDTLAYYITPGRANSNLTASVGMLCQ